MTIRYPLSGNGGSAGFVGVGEAVVARGRSRSRRYSSSSPRSTTIAGGGGRDSVSSEEVRPRVMRATPDANAARPIAIKALRLGGSPASCSRPGSVSPRTLIVPFLGRSMRAAASSGPRQEFRVLARLYQLSGNTFIQVVDFHIHRLTVSAPVPAPDDVPIHVNEYECVAGLHARVHACLHRVVFVRDRLVFVGRDNPRDPPLLSLRLELVDGINHHAD